MNKAFYDGEDLALFSHAGNWKNYISLLLHDYVRGDVLEVGAGIGNNTRLFSRFHYDNWLCLEPDMRSFEVLKGLIAFRNIPNCYAYQGTIDSLSNDQLFDTILYLDVLEHIKNDKEEIVNALRHLRGEGNLIVLAPAHPWLFTPFDKAIGHYRRYNVLRLRAVLPEQLKVLRLTYQDSVGLLASLTNRFFLKQDMPNLNQIRFWDNYMVPLSRVFDKVFGYKWGKSILLIAQKPY